MYLLDQHRNQKKYAHFQNLQISWKNVKKQMVLLEAGTLELILRLHTGYLLPIFFSCLLENFVVLFQVVVASPIADNSHDTIMTSYAFQTCSRFHFKLCTKHGL